MGKSGPCRHCGVTSTPLWRNGPPDKPVLCNACGSRWRTKGSLANYTPLHVREALDLEEMKVSGLKSISFKSKDQKLESEHKQRFCDQNFQKIVDRHTSNCSSYGSALSVSKSYAHGSVDANNITGSAQSKILESLVPSKKITFLNCRKTSSVEKLTKDLYSILHEQQSYLSGSSEEDLLYESGLSHDFTETGHGGVLIRYPNYKPIEEESEASSLALDNTSCISNEHHQWSTSFPINESEGKQFSNTDMDKLKLTIHAQDNTARHKISQDKDSPLLSADLNVEGRKIRATGANSPVIHNFISLKRPHDCKYQNSSELKGTMQSPKRVCKIEASKSPSSGPPQLKSRGTSINLIDDGDIFGENEGDNFRHKGFLASEADKLTADDNADDDLLARSAVFVEAELLQTSEEKYVTSGSSALIAAETEESLSGFQPSRLQHNIVHR